MSTALLVSYIALWVLVIVLSVALLSLYHHFGKMYLVSREGRARQGPDLDRMLPSLHGRDLHGRAVSIPTVGTPALLLFASTSCTICHDLLQDLGAFAAEQTEILIVCAGRHSDVTRWAGDVLDGVSVIPDPDNRMALDQGIVMTPFVVALDATGVVRAKGLVADRGSLEAYAAIASRVDGNRANEKGAVREAVA
jgi:methylamine dehydrogenase accessory protein MauD